MAAARMILALFASGLVAACSDSSTAPGYTVGGTVTGLSSAGLVLQNNGENNRTIAASGNYSFSVGLADGAAYNVTVLAQPAYQSCTVNNGSGTIAAANVNNVTVTCTSLPQTISGTVAGLSGAGLVIQNNGANDLAVANGSFTFGATFASGSTYDVTVLSPNFARDNCAVANGAGTVPKANVTNVTITCISAFTTHEIVTATVTTGAVGSLGAASVTCPGAKRVLSGGYRSGNGIEVWRVWRSRPVDVSATQTGDRGWAVSFASVVAGQNVTVHAVCAIPSPNMSHEVVTATVVTGTAGTGGAVSAPCPGTRRTMGGGYSSESAVEVWRVGRNRGEGAGAQPTAWTIDFTSVTAGQSVSVHAVCAQAPQDLGIEVVTAVTTTGTAGTLGTISAFCPGTKRVLGGGYTSTSAAEVWRVWRNYPVDAGTQVGDRGWAVDFTSVVAGQIVSAYLICGFAST